MVPCMGRSQDFLRGGGGETHQQSLIFTGQFLLVVVSLKVQSLPVSVRGGGGARPPSAPSAWVPHMRHETK